MSLFQYNTPLLWLKKLFYFVCSLLFWQVVAKQVHYICLNTIPLIMFTLKMAKLLLISATLMVITVGYATTKPPYVWKGTNAQLGFDMKTGNNDEQNINAKLHIYHHKNRWNKFLKLATATGHYRGKLTKENYSAEGQTQYYFKGSNHLYLETRGKYDQFSPYLYQIMGAGGYGRNIFKTKTMRWDFETGPGYMVSVTQTTKQTRKQFIIDVESNFYWQITAFCIFHQSLIMNIGRLNIYTKAETSLRNNIFHHLGVQISFKLEHNSVIPPGSKKTERLDTTTNVALIYNF